MKIYIPDIECDSCVKLISRALGNERISFKVNKDSIEVDEQNKDKAISTIKQLNFRTSLFPVDRLTFKQRWKHYKENKHNYKTDIKVLSYALGILIVLGAVEAVLYFTFLKNIPDFIHNYGWWIFYLNISIATTTMGIWHTVSYKARVTCMVGMMIGMTVGMQTGMMIGAVVGATNGFFVGCMVGMLLGTVVGAITGNCCGIMGVMEGMMAGVMGGTMGPMISVMMFSDHILWFMPVYIIINVLILWGMSYMLYEEIIENEGTIRRPVDFISIASIAIIVNFALLGLMIYGPKAAFIGG